MPKMPKIPARDRMLNAVDQARRAHVSGRLPLELIPEHGDIGEVLQRNLDRSYKQCYNSHTAQLHYIGVCIKYYRGEGVANGTIRQILGVTRNQFYTALAVNKAIQDPDIIPYLEDVSPKELQRFSEKDLDYIRNGAWPIIIDPAQEDKRRQEQEDLMRNLLQDLLE